MGNSPQNLLNARVRIVLRRNFREMPVDIMRGMVTDANTVGITISGRHFQELRDSVSGDFEERPLSVSTKIYFVPFSSIKYVDVIMPGSPESEKADAIERAPINDTPIKEYTFAVKR